MNMLRELDCAASLSDKYFAGVFDARALQTMATKNGALAAGFGDQIGELSVGKLADVAVYDGSAGVDHAAVVHAGVEDVHLVLRGGKPLYGDAAVVTALAAGCSPLDVCGNPRSVCIDTPNVTLAQVQSAAQATYPLFFCKGQLPAGEPTCVPYRDTYPNGTSATDGDGDGVPDATDDCPKVFNPPRPMDNGAQPSDTVRSLLRKAGVLKTRHEARHAAKNAAADEADIARISAPEIKGAGYLPAPDIVVTILDGKQPEEITLPGVIVPCPMDREPHRRQQCFLPLAPAHGQQKGH
jgi:hypothetical protein